MGLATSALALGNPKAKLTTLEGCHETSKIAKEQFQQFNFNAIESITSQFESFLNADNLYLKNYNLIYFDGNHSKEATLAYFEQLLPTINNETLWIFDDIHWSKDMEKAWCEIRKHQSVTAAIDLFEMGIVFFNKSYQKKRFKMRL